MDCKITSWRQKKKKLKWSIFVFWLQSLAMSLILWKLQKKTKDDWSNKSAVPVGSCNKSSLCIWGKPPFLKYTQTPLVNHSVVFLDFYVKIQHFNSVTFKPHDWWGKS